jgi:thioredoxin-dependent peroxiredoxin
MNVEIGSKLPSFILPDQEGNKVDITALVGKCNLVIYFYPKDETIGCTKEACTFRDQYEVFRDLGAEVIGISSDSVESHRQFAGHHHLPFILLSDRDKKVRNLFGVPDDLLGLLPGRVTYIVDKQGIIQYIYNSQLRTENHIKKALAILETLR